MHTARFSLHDMCIHTPIFLLQVAPKVPSLAHSQPRCRAESVKGLLLTLERWQVPLWLPISIYPPLEARLSKIFKRRWLLNSPVLKFSASFLFDVLFFISLTFISQACSDLPSRAAASIRLGYPMRHCAILSPHSHATSEDPSKLLECWSSSTRFNALASSSTRLRNTYRAGVATPFPYTCPCASAAKGESLAACVWKRAQRDGCAGVSEVGEQ